MSLVFMCLNVSFTNADYYVSQLNACPYNITVVLFYFVFVMLYTLQLRIRHYKHCSLLLCPRRGVKHCKFAVSTSLCLPVCLLAHLKTACPNFMKFAVRVTCGLGSDLL